MPASEDAILALIDACFPRESPGVVLGRGDDAAVFLCPGDLCVSTDLFVEDVHFRRSYFSPGDIGHKALAVNLSDMAGMGAVPLGFTLGLGLPDGLPTDFLEGMFLDMGRLARKHGCPLLGGDLSRAAQLSLCLTIWGKSGPGGRYLKRKAGRPGDLLFLIGDIGLARSGLSLLEEAADSPAVTAAQSAFPASVAAHLRPKILVEQGAECAAWPCVHGLMDVSDGLARDLPRFLDKGQTADISLPQELLHPEVRARAAALGQDPAAFALLGGEDYALLGCAAPDGFAEFCACNPEVRVIGRIMASSPAGTGIILNGEPFTQEGFDHFAA